MILFYAQGSEILVAVDGKKFFVIKQTYSGCEVNNIKSDNLQEYANWKKINFLDLDNPEKNALFEALSIA